MINIVLVDDHKIFREGLQSLMKEEKDLNIAGQACNEQELMAILQETPIDLILLDVTMEGASGIDITKNIKKIFPKVKILAFSMHDEKEYVIRMLEAGAAGYLLKNTGKDEMLTAIHAVAGGDSFFSHEISEMLLRQVTKSPGHEHSKHPLSKREAEVLKLIAEGYSNPEIAEKLFISIRTVDTHRRNILDKLRLKNTAGLVRYAIRQGFVQDS